MKIVGERFNTKSLYRPGSPAPDVDGPRTPVGGSRIRVWQTFMKGGSRYYEIGFKNADVCTYYQLNKYYVRL